jgi:hypothetical protein
MTYFSSFYQCRFGWAGPNIRVTEKLRIQTKMLLVISAMDLASAFTYLVTVTPAILKIIIRNMVTIAKTISQ